MPSIERHGYFDSRVEARVGMIGPEPFDFVERGQHDGSIEHPVYFAPDSTVGRWNGAWIDAQIEQRGVDPATAFERELLIDAGSPVAPEAAHQRAIEEDQIGHGGPVRRRPQLNEPVAAVAT